MLDLGAAVIFAMKGAHFTRLTPLGYVEDRLKSFRGGTIRFWLRIYSGVWNAGK